MQGTRISDDRLRTMSPGPVPTDGAGVSRRQGHDDLLRTGINPASDRTLFVCDFGLVCPRRGLIATGADRIDDVDDINVGATVAAARYERNEHYQRPTQRGVLIHPHESAAKYFEPALFSAVYHTRGMSEERWTARSATESISVSVDAVRLPGRRIVLPSRVWLGTSNFVSGRIYRCRESDEQRNGW